MNKQLFEDLTQSLREMGKIRRGEMKPSRVFKFDPENDIARLRAHAFQPYLGSPLFTHASLKAACFIVFPSSIK